MSSLQTGQNKIVLTPRFQKALTVCIDAHSQQKRKGGTKPYSTHPISVAWLVSQDTDDEDTLIACLFHDILEDVPDIYSKEDMQTDFGDSVVEIVMGVTKDPSLKSWKARADKYLKSIDKPDNEKSLLVCAGDKIHNGWTIVEAYKERNDELWQIFNSGKDDQKWWYRSVNEIIQRRLPGTNLAQQLQEIVERFQKI